MSVKQGLLSLTSYLPVSTSCSGIGESLTMFTDDHSITIFPINKVLASYGNTAAQSGKSFLFVR